MHATAAVRVNKYIERYSYYYNPLVDRCRRFYTYRSRGPSLKVANDRYPFIPGYNNIDTCSTLNRYYENDCSDQDDLTIDSRAPG